MALSFLSLQALILGIVQGLTEFLPISSSAHLILFPWFFGWRNTLIDTLTFDVALHAGTLVAILLYFFTDWVELSKGFLKILAKRRVETFQERLILYIILATVPAALVGLFLEKVVEENLRNPLLISLPLIVVSLVMIFAERRPHPSYPLERITLKDSFTIGLAQAIALLPGVSRSGITITTGLLQGYDREAATRFSFLLFHPGYRGGSRSPSAPSFLREYLAGWGHLCHRICLIGHFRLSRHRLPHAVSQETYLERLCRLSPGVSRAYHLLGFVKMIAWIIEILASFIIATISSGGYIGIILLMAIESACIPLPSEIIMPFSGYLVFRGEFALFGVGMAGAFGCVVGSVPAYYLGLHGGRPLIERYGKYVLISHHDLDIADRWFARYGDWAIFFSRLLPVVRTFISFPAGVARMNVPRFILYTFIGSFPWCLGLAYIGMKLGENWDTLGVYFHKFDIVIGGLIAAGVIYYLFHHVRKKNH